MDLNCLLKFRVRSEVRGHYVEENRIELWDGM